MVPRFTNIVDRVSRKRCRHAVVDVLLFARLDYRGHGYVSRSSVFASYFACFSLTNDSGLWNLDEVY
jgi:hypothetical protein